MKKEAIPNLDEIAQTVRKAFKEIEEGINSGELSAEEREEIRLELEKGIFNMYKIKVDMRLDDLLTVTPDMPVRDVIIELLAVLRPDTSAKIASQVADYISKEWEKRILKMAA